MPTLRALIVQATGMTEKLAPFALAMTTFDVVLTLLEDASGDKKKVVPATAGGPGLTNSIAKVMALTPLPFVPTGPVAPVAPAELVPEFVTTADVPDAPVVVVPTLTVEEEPARARTAQIPPLPDTFVAGSTAVFD